MVVVCTGRAANLAAPTLTSITMKKHPPSTISATPIPQRTQAPENQVMVASGEYMEAVLMNAIGSLFLLLIHFPFLQVIKVFLSLFSQLLIQVALTSSPRLKPGDSQTSRFEGSCFIEVAPIHLCGGESDTISTG